MFMKLEMGLNIYAHWFLNFFIKLSKFRISMVYKRLLEIENRDFSTQSSWFSSSHRLRLSFFIRSLNSCRVNRYKSTSCLNRCILTPYLEIVFRFNSPQSSSSKFFNGCIRQFLLVERFRLISCSLNICNCK